MQIAMAFQKLMQTLSSNPLPLAHTLHEPLSPLALVRHDPLPHSTVIARSQPPSQHLQLSQEVLDHG